MKHDTRSANRKILVTGGHITPALATVAVLRAEHPDWEIVFIGRPIALEGSRIRSEEQALVREQGMRFLPITAGRLKREGGAGAVVPLLKTPVGFVQAAYYLLRERPDAVLSFGGYVALPVIMAAWLLRIPVVTHEQTTNPGLANRLIARVARKICVSFPDTGAMFGAANSKVEYTGLPVRESVFSPPDAPSFAVPETKNRPILFIAGGSTGSVSVNTVLYEALPQLLEQFTVIHQVGRLSIEKAEGIKKSLGRHRESYMPFAYLSQTDYAWVLSHASLIVGRSGANTVTEVAISGKPAIFIPLPWSAGEEQLRNAEVLKHAGSAEILPQDKLTAGTLTGMIATVLRTLPERSARAKQLTRMIPRDGAVRLAAVVSRVLTG